jgi:hydroxymethylpyrimidine pyrophosphatase-like HAD family hydrolase
VLVTSDNRYIIKINHDKNDSAYYKELAFFANNHNPLPATKLLYSNNELKILVFYNVLYANEFDLLLFDYLQTSGISIEQIKSAMRSCADVCANIHRQKGFKHDAPIYQDESFVERRVRIDQRLSFLSDRGYQNLPSLESFQTAEQHVLDTELVLNHGDMSPYNLFVDTWTGEDRALIDGEESSPGARSKELAKVIIALIDARKNNPDLIGHLGEMLTVFLDEYFKKSGFDKEKALKSIPYYLATELLWYAEDTESVFQNPCWVNWRLDLCSWALSQPEFKAEELVKYLGEELQNNNVKEAYIISRNLPVDPASKTIVDIPTGDDAYFEIEVTLEKEFKRTLSALNIAAEFYTDANTGIWHNVGPLELVGLYKDKAYFKGRILMKEPSGTDSPYNVTARFSSDEGKTWTYVKLPHGNAQIRAITSFAGQDISNAWDKFLKNTYNGFMFDFDGNLRFYNKEIPLELYDLIIDKISSGIPFAICTSRSNNNEIEYREINEFLLYLEQRAGELGKEIDLKNIHVYMRNGKYGYNYGTKNEYYKISLEKVSKDAVREIIRREEFSRFIKENTYYEDHAGVYFAFRGGIDRALFAKKLNEELEKVNKNLRQKVIALYTEDYFELCPKEGTKAIAAEDFSNRIGIRLECLLRTGDQGQMYGIDWPMVNRPGGASTFHANPDSTALYPLSVPMMTGKRSPDANIYLLKTLNFVPPSGIAGIKKSITETQL